MRIVIIEDELEAAFDLRDAIVHLGYDEEKITLVSGVESGVAWFDQHPSPDLIISDIELGDGLAFDIFRHREPGCPVIFCTAFDQYAIEAFEFNGVDYLLKPVDAGLLTRSLEK
ncbi:MAG TPA: response regulator, partial [Chitinophagaceae bacterium]